MWSWAEKLFLGVDLNEEQRRSDEADAKLRALNQDALARGVYDQPTFDQAEAHVSAGELDVNGQVGEAAREGLNQGIDNVRTTIGDIATSPFKLIDWRIWILAGGALFVYMGGWVYLKGIINRRK